MYFCGICLSFRRDVYGCGCDVNEKQHSITEPAHWFAWKRSTYVEIALWDPIFIEKGMPS